MLEASASHKLFLSTKVSTSVQPNSTKVAMNKLLVAQTWFVIKIALRVCIRQITRLRLFTSAIQVALMEMAQKFPQSIVHYQNSALANPFPAYMYLLSHQLPVRYQCG